MINPIESNPWPISNALLLISAVLVLADWLLDEKQRKEMKEVFGVWSLYMSEISYQKIIEVYSQMLLQRLRAFFGDKSISHRRVSTTFFISTVLTILVSGIFAFFNASSMMHSPISESYYWGYFWFFFLFFCLPMLIPTLATDWLSLSITLNFLSYAHKKHSVWVYLAIIVIDLILAAFIGIIAAIVSSYLFGGASMEIIKYLDYYKYFPGQWSLYGGLIFIVIATLTAAIPTLFHALIIVSFIIIKTTALLWVKPVSLVLMRFYDSPKGVFANMGVAIGVIVVLFKAVIK